MWGDYYDLKAIHSFIHFICSKSPSHTELKEYALALAYDIRHAYQGDRLTKQFGIDDLDKATYRGVHVIWPTYLSQIAILRQMAGYVPHTTFEQSCLYLLENCARMALLRYDEATGTECLNWLETPCRFGNEYLVEYLNYLAKQYIGEGKGGKTRFRQLPIILRRMHFLSDDYRDFAGHLQDVAIEKKCSPTQLMDWNDWPDFKW